MCADDDVWNLDHTYKSLKRWYTGITRNCNCEWWRKKDNCYYYYIIYPSVHELPKCWGWKECPQCIERYHFTDYEGKSAPTRFKEKFLAFANTDRGAWIVAGVCLGGIMLVNGLLMWLISGTFKFFM